MKSLVFVIGVDDLLRSRAIAKIRSDLLPEGAAAMDQEVYPAADVTLDRLLQSLRTPPWIGPVRLIYLREADSWIGPHVATLQEIAHGRYPSAVLVIEASGLKKGKLPPGLEAEWIVCDPPSPQALPGWIEKEARRLGVPIEPEATFLLGMTVAESESGMLYELSTALDVLALYRKGAVIRRTDVENFFGGGESLSVFQWADGIFEGHLESSLLGLESLLVRGEVPLRLIGLLERHAKILVEIHSEPGPEGPVAPRVPPFARGRYAAQGARFEDVRRLWGLFETLAEADLTLKSLPLPSRAVMTHLILGLTGC